MICARLRYEIILPADANIRQAARRVPCISRRLRSEFPRAVQGGIGLAATGHADRRHEPGTSEVHERHGSGPQQERAWVGASLARKSAGAADGVDRLAEVAGQEVDGDDLPHGPGLDHAVATGYLDRFPAGLPVALYSAC
jgi:hypothetical protein